MECALKMAAFAGTNCFSIGPYGKMKNEFSELEIWLNPNCTGIIIGWSVNSLVFVFMPIGNSRWPPSQDKFKHKENVQN